MDWLSIGIAFVLAASFFGLVGVVAYLNGQETDDEPWGR